MGAGEALAASIAVGIGGAALGLAGWRAAGWLVGVDALDRTLAALTLALAGLCLVLQALGIVGLLERWPVTVALVVLAALVLVRVPAPAGGFTLPRGPAWLAALAIGTAVAVLALILGLQGFTASEDTVGYHAPNAGTWLATSSLLDLPLALPGYPTNAYPSDHTLTGLWLMLATGSDQLAYTVNVAWGALAVVGTAALTRELGGRAAFGALLALGVVLTPIVFATQANSLMTDLGASGCVAVGAACALRAVREDEPSLRWAVLGGVAIGLGAGSKVTVWLAAVGILAIPVLLRGRRGLRPATVMGVAAVPLTLFWFIRNAVEFGNPLFPLDAGPFTGYTSPLTRLDTAMAEHVLDRDGTVLRRWLDLGWDVAGPALLLVPAALIIGLLAWRRADRRLAVTAGFALYLVAGYLITPYTGGGPDGIVFLIGSQLRYAIPALLVAAAVVGAGTGRWAWVAAAPLLVWGAVKTVEGFGVRSDLDVTTRRGLEAVAVAALVAGLVWWRPRIPRAAMVAGGLALVVGGTAFALHEQDPRPEGVTEALLAQRCPGGRVAVAYADNLRALMGREFEVEVVGLDHAAAAGRAPFADAAPANRRVAQLAPALLAVQDATTQPAGYRGPPGWQAVGKSGATTILAPPGGGCGP